jgi:hypothetical protein
LGYRSQKKYDHQNPELNPCCFLLYVKDNPGEQKIKEFASQVFNHTHLSWVKIEGIQGKLFTN